MWNYRIVDMACDDEEPIYEIREVYYNSHNQPFAHGSAGVVGESMGEMKEAIELMELAFTKPVLLSTCDFENDYDH